MSEPEDRPVRVGVLSAGAWSAATHIPALLAEGASLQLVTSPDAAKAEWFATEFGFAETSTDWRAVDLGVLDAAVVSSPPAFHRDQVLAALRAGVDVLCEKPMAIDPLDAAAMCHEADRLGRRLLVAFAWNGTPVFRRARELIAEGRLGTIEHVMVHLSVNTRGVLRGDPDSGWEQGPKSETGTYQDPAVSGGGSAAVSMSHVTGLISYLIDDRISQVSSVLFPADDPLDLHDAVAMRAAGGASVAVSAASAHRRQTTVSWIVAIYGSAGQLHIDTDSGSLRVLGETEAGDLLEVDSEWCRYDGQGPTRALVAGVRGAELSPEYAGGLGLHAVEVAAAVYESARTGRSVAL